MAEGRILKATKWGGKVWEGEEGPYSKI
jgi:hypothetical protein